MRAAAASPARGLPGRGRPAVSMPWSTALRTRCSSESASWLSTPRSSSVSAPSTSQRTSLPCARARSRTARCSWSVMVDTGTMRVRITRSCRTLRNRDSSLYSRRCRRVDPEAVLQHPADAQVRGRRLADQPDELLQPLGLHHHDAGVGPAARRPVGAVPVPVAGDGGAVSGAGGGDRWDAGAEAAAAAIRGALVRAAPGRCRSGSPAMAARSRSAPAKQAVDHAPG